MPNDFEYQVFLSYARNDDKPRGEPGWVTQFHERLSDTLEERGGREVKLWRDERMQRNEDFDVSIRTALDESALLVALGSPQFFRSSYCRKELEFFATKAESDGYGLHLGSTSRIFTVLQLGVHHVRWFDHCRRHNTYEFYSGKAEDELGSRLWPRNEAYQRAMERLADEILRTLDLMEAQKRAEQPEDVVHVENRRAEIVLTDVPDHLKAFRARISDALDRLEVPVETLSGGAVPACDLSVHLLSRFSTEQSLLQLREALERASRQIVWLDPRCKVPDEDGDTWRELLSEARRRSSFELIQERQPEAISVLPERVSSIFREQQRARGGNGMVMLNIHESDMTNAWEVINYLDDQDSVPLVDWCDDGSLGDIDEFQRKLLQARALIVFFGNVDSNWVSERLKMAIKVVAELDHKLPVWGVLMAPPQTQEAHTSIEVPIPIPLELLDITNGFREETLDTLLEKLHGVAS